MMTLTNFVFVEQWELMGIINGLLPHNARNLPMLLTVGTLKKERIYKQRVTSHCEIPTVCYRHLECGVERHVTPVVIPADVQVAMAAILICPHLPM